MKIQPTPAPLQGGDFEKVPYREGIEGWGFPLGERYFPDNDGYKILQLNVV
jgi:hypothetical protein